MRPLKSPIHGDFKGFYQAGGVFVAVTAKRDIKRVRDIRDLLSNKKLTASFQQIVSVSRKTVVGAEGLIRCANTLTGENIVPFDLFAEAGAAHLTLEMDRVCRATILEEFSAVHRDFPDKLLFLNINTAILDCSAGSGYLLEQVRRSGINPRNIVIEISEINVLSNAILKRFVDTYKHYGFMVALDDVGTGFSNMTGSAGAARYHQNRQIARQEHPHRLLQAGRVQIADHPRQQNRCARHCRGRRARGGSHTGAPARQPYDSGLLLLRAGEARQRGGAVCQR